MSAPTLDPPQETQMTTHTVTVTGSSTPLAVGADQSILDAALRAGQWLPHSCTQGTCGTCKLQVCSGDVDHRDSPEFTLTGDERDAGLALACMATPRTDVTVEPLNAVDDDTPHHPLRDFTATVMRLDDVAADTRRLVVELDSPMEFNAGQYAELLVPASGVRRQYSMANPPSDTRRLEFHVKRTPGGAATDGWIFRDLAVGHEFTLSGPLGQFNLVKPQDQPAILIGGGTGLAPLKSIIRHALENDLVPALHLYHGGRRREDLYDVDYFTALAAEHEHFHYRPALSEGQWTGDELTCAGALGMVTDVVVADFASCKGLSAYLCGPPAMVEAAVKSLKRRRMAPRLIFREEFTVAASPAPFDRCESGPPTPRPA